MQSQQISIVHTHYNTHHMVEGQSVTSDLTTMKEYRSQLKRMGEIIALSSHSATILHNLPESWCSIIQKSILTYPIALRHYQETFTHAIQVHIHA